MPCTLQPFIHPADIIEHFFYVPDIVQGAGDRAM